MGIMAEMQIILRKGRERQRHWSRRGGEQSKTLRSLQLGSYDPTLALLSQVLSFAREMTVVAWKLPIRWVLWKFSDSINNNSNFAQIHYCRRHHCVQP